MMPFIEEAGTAWRHMQSIYLEELDQSISQEHRKMWKSTAKEWAGYTITPPEAFCLCDHSAVSAGFKFNFLTSFSLLVIDKTLCVNHNLCFII